MIKFFRKIRQNLMDKGDAKRYLLYAIGEILLVMIGILLALQVNNWNNQKKDAQLTQQYLMGLKEDAQNNRVALDRYIRRAKNYIEKVADFEQRKGGSLSKIDLDSIGIQRQTYFFKMDTYEEILSNGHLKLLPPEVKSVLAEINSFFKSINKIDEQEARVINNQQLKMMNYFELRRGSQPNVYQVIVNPYVNTQQALFTYRNYINSSYSWMKNQQYFYGEMKKKQLELIA